MGTGEAVVCLDTHHIALSKLIVCAALNACDETAVIVVKAEIVIVVEEIISAHRARYYQGFHLQLYADEHFGCRCCQGVAKQNGLV